MALIDKFLAVVRGRRRELEAGAYNPCASTFEAYLVISGRYAELMELEEKLSKLLNEDGHDGG